VRELAAEVLAIAREGLRRRARLDGAGADETRHLDILDARVAQGRTGAQDLLALYAGPWGGSVDPSFEHCRM
jgi:glutamate--cysteine ligase